MQDSNPLLSSATSTCSLEAPKHSLIDASAPVSCVCRVLLSSFGFVRKSFFAVVAVARKTNLTTSCFASHPLSIDSKYARASSEVEVWNLIINQSDSESGFAFLFSPISSICLSLATSILRFYCFVRARASVSRWVECWIKQFRNRLRLSRDFYAQKYNLPPPPRLLRVGAASPVKYWFARRAIKRPLSRRFDDSKAI